MTLEFLIGLASNALLTFLKQRKPDEMAKFRSVMAKVYRTIRAAYAGDADFALLVQE